MSINRWIYITCVYAQFCLCNPWTVACQVPLFMGFSKQEYWSRLPFPSPRERVTFFFFINLVSIQLFKKSICIYISRIIFKCLSISKHLNVNQIPLFCMVVFRNLKKLNEIIGNTENIIIFSCTCHIKMYIKIVTKFIRISLFKI